MKSDSIRAAVELRRADSDKLNQQRLLAGKLGWPYQVIQTAHGSANALHDFGVVEPGLHFHVSPPCENNHACMQRQLSLNKHNTCMCLRQEQRFGGSPSWRVGNILPAVPSGL